ncbi:MAG: prephenate dehydratase [Kiritimatiellaeota bacterium]|nr:prephenate dehydratase [Kiritimatiellota bacterium]
MDINEIAYLGPEGTYTHQIAVMRFGDDTRMIPASTVFDACEHVKRTLGAYAVVPIENSSGGTITSTVDLLLNDPALTIMESMTLIVKLALLARGNEDVEIIYSHFAPFKHCSKWIRENYPAAKCREVSSTAEGAVRAAREPKSAVLGSKKLSEIYDLKVLHYPVEQEIVNETEFILLTSEETRNGENNGDKTSLAVELVHGPGSLCSFLIPFRDNDVNLTRIISRPIYGVPNEYAFYIDIRGNRDDDVVKKALKLAADHCDSLRIIGSHKHAGRFRS